MFKVLFILFVIVPIIEIAVLMQVGAVIGAWPTVAIVIITAWLGAKNVRQQGLATIQNLQNKMAVGEMPSEEIVAGLLLLVAGVLLVTPGFVTDAFGLSLLVPSVRRGLVASVQQHLSVTTMHQSTMHQRGSQDFGNSPFQQQFESQRQFQQDRKHDGNTIEGEFERTE
ncbi:FxsA family protein [Thalassotalea euphylliae]|uniref:FxsA family protein n=1 Tax=Thalassotalea euphylliae TaxID=1655234 RepID=UPI0036271DBD